MKSASHLNHTDSHAATASRRSRSKPAHSSEYMSPAETRALLANSLASRQLRLQADDMMSTDEAAILLSTSRVTINAWIAKGRAIGLTQAKRGFRMPRWQFEPLVWDALPQLTDALGVKEGWALLAFLESPHEALGGLSPRQAMELGNIRHVIDTAAREGN